MGLLSKAVSGSSGFDDSASQGGLLKRVFQKRHSAAENAQRVFERKEQDTVSQPLEQAIMEKLSGACVKFGAIQGIIMGALNHSGDEFTGRLAFLVSGFGTAQLLSRGRCLVLFASSKDSDLIGKHLAKTVPGNIVFSFKADDPREAFPLVKPYL